MDIPESGDSSNFDPDFASPAEWTAMYRAKDLQSVPARMPVKGQQWKMPALASWTEFQENLIPQATIDRWYAPGGEHAGRQNMGVITGRASRNVFVIDLDDQKGPQAEAWWQGLLELHNSRIDLETVEQRTGGGGRQKLFRAPPDWVAPTNKTSIHIDIRGQGGFAMLPPSRHESGKDYAWLPGRAPWEIPIADAPEWLLEALEALVEAFGGHPTGVRTQATTAIDPFGNQVDGREEYMTKLVWAALLGYRQDNPIPPSNSDRDAVWADYERNTRSRLPEDGRSNTDRLEEEGRGPSLFANKWRRALKKWHGKVAEDAKNRHPKPDRQGHEQPPAPVIDPQTGRPKLLILTSAEFLAGYSPPAYLIDGVIQRGYLYSLTARTGHGKTAVALYIAQAIARGVDMHGCKVLPGTVLILAGENPDDVRARFFVLGKAYGFDPAASKIRWIPGVKHLPSHMPIIRQEVSEIDDLVLVLVDTAAAYFPGTETNSNSEQGAYARLLRDLTFLKGKPAAIALSHPVKNAARDNLLPMGGSAFLNEVDGNLTLWSDNEGQTTLHWQGKFRGPEFNPMSFEMVEEHCDTVKDEDGRLLPSVVAKPLSEEQVEASEDRAENEENKLMRAMHGYGAQAASFSKLADKLGWEKWTVQRLMKRLKEGKLVEQKRNKKYLLTNDGVEAIGGLKQLSHQHD